jgi:hypothetical protein
VNKKVRRVHAELSRQSAPAKRRTRRGDTPNQVVARQLVRGSKLEPPPGSKWVGDWRGITQSSEREPDPKTQARLAAIDAGLAAFETHKDNLLAVVLSGYERGPKSVLFDADRAWGHLVGIARLYFEWKWGKQEERPASDRKKRLRKFAKVLREACRCFDEAKQLPLLCDIDLGYAT